MAFSIKEFSEFVHNQSIELTTTSDATEVAVEALCLLKISNMTVSNKIPSEQPNTPPQIVTHVVTAETAPAQPDSLDVRSGRSTEIKVTRSWLRNALKYSSSCDKAVYDELNSFYDSKEYLLTKERRVNAVKLAELVRSIPPSVFVERERFNRQIEEVLKFDNDLNPDGCGPCIDLTKKNIQVIIDEYKENVDTEYFQKALKYRGKSFKRVVVQVGKLTPFIFDINKTNCSENALAHVYRVRESIRELGYSENKT